MGFNHVLLEVFCLKNIDANVCKPRPEFCTAAEDPEYPGDWEPGYGCLFHKCPFVDFTSCENTLCYINEKSEMEHGILFGGDMGCEDDTAGIERWKKMSIDAVERTYQEFMKSKEDDAKHQ